MQFNFPWFSLIYLVSAILTLVLATVIWKRQFDKGAAPFTVLLFAMSVWTTTALLEAGAIDIPTKIIFAKAEYLALVSSGALSLTFILEYTHSEWIKRRRNRVLLWIIPVLSLAMVWTNELHGLVWSNIYLNQSANWSISVYEHGPLYWLVPAYQYLLYTGGILVLIRHGRRRQGTYRRQVIWLLAGSLVPIAGSLIYITGESPIKGFDLTPVAIGVMGVIYAFTIFHFRLLDSLPTATTAFVKNLQDGFLLLDSENYIISVNPATRRILGEAPGGLVGQKLEKVWPELKAISADHTSGQHRELSLENGDGITYLDIGIETFWDPYGTLTARLLIIRDISELKLTRLELEAEIIKRSQFTRTIVHELRNPLTAVISSSHELEEHTDLDENIRMALVRNISRSATDLEERVNELFELARGELGLLEINTESLDMNRLIREIGAEMAPVAASKGLQLSWQTAEETALVRGDKKRLRQVLSNLLGNAIKYTPEGQIEIRSRRESPQWLLIEVQDSGRGIGKEELENLFDPYLRSASQKTKTSGLGIGLSLSKKYIELHQGRIWAASLPGKGTTISFKLPL
jgi:PAS domain S-box-containing protein